MDLNALAQGLIGYVFLLILLTFHEYAHARMALHCGDDTARMLGRVSLNPLVHIDLVGTVILPMFFILSGSTFFFGWAKPVPFDPRNLRQPVRDSILIAMAGPAMNLVLAVLLLPLAKLGLMLADSSLAQTALPGMLVEIGEQMTLLSLLLCFFNLIPVPPLDGSHVLRHLVGMSDETYFKLAQFGFLIVIVLINVPVVKALLYGVTFGTFRLLAQVYGII